MSEPNYLLQAISTEDWTMVEEQLQSSTYICKDVRTWTKVPYFVDCRGKTKVLPLHIATAMSSPPKIVERLLKVYPDSVTAKESGMGRLPLHVACRVGAPIDVVRSLIRQYPRATCVPDKMGRLPLHYAVRYSSEEIIWLLLSADPLGNSARIYDKAGCLPLHTAAQVGSPIGVIRMLVNAYPASVYSTTHTGISTRAIVDVVNHANKKDVLKLLQSFGPFEEKKDSGMMPPSLEKKISQGDSSSAPSLHGRRDHPSCVDQSNAMWEPMHHER